MVKDKAFPSLGAEVYVNALNELQIKYVVVDLEADDSIVAIANFYECPVLSNDSDFFLHNIKGGLVRVNKIKFSYYDASIEADVYYYQHFCDQFEFRDESVRLIIPVLVGNDLWSGFNSFVDTKGDRSLLPFIRCASSFAFLESFCWKKGCHIDGDKKIELETKCQRSRDMYDSDDVFEFTDKLDIIKLTTSNGDPLRLPQWVVANYRKGYTSLSLQCVC